MAPVGARGLRTRVDATVATIAGITVVGFVLRLAVLVRPIGVIDKLFIPDDTYYTLTIARSLANGDGPTVDGQHAHQRVPGPARVPPGAGVLDHRQPRHRAPPRSRAARGRRHRHHRRARVGGVPLRRTSRGGGRGRAVGDLAGRGVDGARRARDVAGDPVLGRPGRAVDVGERPTVRPRRAVVVGVVAGLAVLRADRHVAARRAARWVAALAGSAPPGRARRDRGCGGARPVVDLVHDPVRHAHPHQRRRAPERSRRCNRSRASRWRRSPARSPAGPFDVWRSLREWLNDHPVAGVVVFWLHGAGPRRAGRVVGAASGDAAARGGRAARCSPPGCSCSTRGSGWRGTSRATSRRWRASSPLILAVGIARVWRTRGTWRIPAFVATAVVLAGRSGRGGPRRFTPTSPRRTATSSEFDTVTGYRDAAMAVVQFPPDGQKLGAWQSGAFGFYANDRLTVVNLDGVVNPDAADATTRRHAARVHPRAQDLDWVADFSLRIVGFTLVDAEAAASGADGRRRSRGCRSSRRSRVRDGGDHVAARGRVLDGEPEPAARARSHTGSRGRARPSRRPRRGSSGWRSRRCRR